MSLSDLQVHSPIASLSNTIFTARSYASVVYAVVMCLSVRLSVRPSVTMLALFQKGGQNAGSANSVVR